MATECFKMPITHCPMRYEIRDNVMSTIQSAIADDQIIIFSSSFEFFIPTYVPTSSTFKKINILSKAKRTKAFDQNDEKI